MVTVVVYRTSSWDSAHSGCQWQIAQRGNAVEQCACKQSRVIREPAIVREPSNSLTEAGNLSDAGCRLGRLLSGRDETVHERHSRKEIGHESPGEESITVGLQ